MTLLPVLLPEGFEPKVSVNDKLTAGSIIAQREGSSSENIINIATSLSIPPKDINKFLQKHLGDSVENGEVVATKKGGLGLGSKKVLSEFSGTVVKIDEESGEMHIRGMGKVVTDTLLSPIDGIVDFCNNEKIVIKTDKQAIMVQDSVGKENTGELLLIPDFDQNKLTSGIQDKIILVKQIDKISLFKAIGLDVGGVVTEDLIDADFVDLSEKRINVPVMVVTEDSFKKLEKANKKKVFLDVKDKGIVVL